jgi:hypothetical protein
MGHTTDFDDVRRAMQPFGTTATLITINESTAPHVVTAVIDVDDGYLVADVGAKTRSNLAERPALALVWNPVDESEYQLILDGRVADLGEPNDRGVSTIRVAVTGGIMHRIAGLPPGPPTCRSLAS